jgi:hypothetical protein
MAEHATSQIRVAKKDGSAEPFDRCKLAGSMWRAMACCEGDFADAVDLAAAIEIYLSRHRRRCISSSAVFEMTVKVLRRAGLAVAAERMETFRAERIAARNRIRLMHSMGQATWWDKSWLAELAVASWNLSRTTARMIAGQIEQDLREAGVTELPRGIAIALLNERVAEFGLADAVPVRK